MVPEEAVRYDSLDTVLEKTSITKFIIPSNLEGYDEVNYYFYSEEIAMVEYIGESNSLVLVCLAPSCQTFMVLETRIHPNTNMVNERYGVSVFVPDTRLSYKIYGYNTENKGENIQFSIGSMSNNYESYELYSKKPMEYEEFCDLCTKILLMNLK